MPKYHKNSQYFEELFSEREGIEVTWARLYSECLSSLSAALVISLACLGEIISDQDNQNLKKSTFTGRTLKIYSCPRTSQDQRCDLLNLQLNSNNSVVKVHVFKDLTVGYSLSVSWTPHHTSLNELPTADHIRSSTDLIAVIFPVLLDLSGLTSLYKENESSSLFKTKTAWVVSHSC